MTKLKNPNYFEGYFADPKKVLPDVKHRLRSETLVLRLHDGIFLGYLLADGGTFAVKDKWDRLSLNDVIGWRYAKTHEIKIEEDLDNNE